MRRLALDKQALREAHREALRALPHFEQLSLVSRRGAAGGQILSRVSGTSLEFNEFRAYTPGDDIRSLDWRASARALHPLVRTYREEILPCVEVVLDLTPSMFFMPSKAARTLELLYFIFECCKRDNASSRYWTVGTTAVRIAPDELERYELDTDELLPDEGQAPAFDEVPFRTGSLRVILTDLLFPRPPAALLNRFGKHSIIIAPRCAEEHDPLWTGNVLFAGCETGVQRRQSVDEGFTSRYRSAYEAHFTQWREESLRIGSTLCLVPSEVTLADAVLPLVMGSPVAR